MLIASIFFAVGILFTFKKYISIPLTALIFGFSLLEGIYSNDFSDLSSFIFISSLPIIMSIIVLDKLISFRSKIEISYTIDEKKNHFDFQNFFWVLFLTCIFLESYTLVSWLIFPLLPDILQTHWSWQINQLETNFFYSIGLLSPVLLMLSLFSFIIKPILSRLNTRFNQLLENKKSNIQNYSKSENKEDTKDLISNPSTQIKHKKTFSFLDSNAKSFFFVVIIAIIPSLLITLYPYSIEAPQVFSGPSLPGVLGYDFSAYSESVNLLISKNNADSFLTTLFVEIENGSRPLSILSIYLIHIVSGQPVDAVLTYLPSIIAPFLVLSVYFFVRIAYPEDSRIAVIASIMTAVSHQIVVGFYAGLYANWMGLVVMFVSSLFLIKCFQNTNHLHRNITLFAAFTILIMLFHNFMWAYFISVVVFLLAWTAVQRIRAKKSLRLIVLLSIVIAGIIAVDVLKSEFTGATGGFENDLAVVTVHTDITESQKVWENLDKAFHNYLGGFLTNSMVLLLLFLWTLQYLLLGLFQWLQNQEENLVILYSRL